MYRVGQVKHRPSAFDILVGFLLFGLGASAGFWLGLWLLVNTI